jgi:hypothetical protein
MKTTNLITSSILVLTAIFIIASCDKVDAPYVIPTPPKDTAACPVPDFLAVTAHFKRVLLEDYTGHTCVNCPRAALIAHDLKEQYKDSLVVIAVHAGFYAKPGSADPWTYDFRTTAGDEWNTLFKISSNPNGLVSRKGYPSNEQVISKDLWANTIRAAVKETPLIDLQLITEYDNSEDKLCIHTKTSFLQTISDRTLNISVVITEDSIVQAQKNSEPEVGATPQILDYVHMHVMRGAVNGTWGTLLHAKSDLSNEPVIKSFKTHFTNFNLNTMKPKNCHVIAFVYDVDTKEVLQVAESDLR